MVTTIPETVTDRAGRQLTIHRAWPRQGGRLIFEASDSDGGQIRAGSVGADGRVRLSPFAEDPVLSGLPGAAAQGELLVHRYKRRAVVRDAVGFTKLLAPGKADEVAASHRFMRSLAQPSGIVVPDVVVHHPESVTLTAVHGASFHELGQASPPANHPAAPPTHRVAEETWAAAWQEWSKRWPLLAVSQHSAAAGAAELPTHGTRDECRTVSRWVNYAQEFGVLPVAADRLQRASAHVSRLLISGAPQTAVLSHRDLHDKQLLFNPESGSVGLIDCDTVTVAEPALDLANLLVHIDLRRAQGVYSAAAARTAKKAILGTASVMDVSEVRLNAYAASTKLRLACLYAFRPAYRSVAHQWFERLEHELTESAVA
ncbi:phosphotransferase [Arthrobacter sp. CAN_A1]|uniref:phosphotransferase n=1 Tax=Arthrobacter sp. CAN_A1 TaxID=2787717 RepID=UPI0018C96F8D